MKKYKNSVPLVGMFYRGITAPFECYAYAELDEWNEYDKTAIGVYSSNGNHLGYIARGCKSELLKLFRSGEERIYGYAKASIGAGYELCGTFKWVETDIINITIR